MAGTLGVPCPGCGLDTRNPGALAGRRAPALRLHPLVWLLMPLFVGFVGTSVVELVRGPPATPRAPRIRWNARSLSAARDARARAVVRSLALALRRLLRRTGTGRHTQ